MTMITPSYLGETIEYSSLHACRSTLEDPTVAAVARGGQCRVVVVRMALRTRNGDVRTRKRKRRFVVVECRRSPG